MPGPELIDICPENFDVYIEEILAIERGSFPSPWSYNAFRSETEKRISTIWALILDGSVAGYACFWTVEKEMQLLNLAIHPERRRNRLGWFLLSKLIE
ncbi:MAG: GNAT family N-acetyltransferase, partial [Deltaproteobacteria bacterium]|nr:GNAT family N-acetyltransferase [Deltaproteobacteria bacterium]